MAEDRSHTPLPVDRFWTVSDVARFLEASRREAGPRRRGIPARAQKRKRAVRISPNRPFSLWTRSGSNR